MAIFSIREELIKPLKYLITVLGALITYSPHVYALGTCSTLPPGLPMNYTVPLAPQNITVGPDMPVGTVVYRVNFNHPTINGFTCGLGTTFSFPQRLSYTSNPMPLSSWSGNPFPGRVYNTSVPGIGVAAWSDNNNTALPTDAWVVSNINNFYVRINVILSFIKIGQVSPGTITAASLPSIQLDFAPDPSMTGFPIRIYNLKYSGTINVVSQTCTTPDVNVSLGSYETSIFNAVGTVTPWIDASIVLNNCPRFYGYYNDASYNNSTGAGTTTTNTAVANTLNVKLTPQNSIWNTANGIMNVTSGTGSATGIGIQLAWGDKSGSPQPMNWSSNYNYTPGNTTATTFKIPLSARYYQTSNTVTPGRANGNVTFTINYY